MAAIVDLSKTSDADLARWARARIASDKAAFETLIRRAGEMILDDEEYQGDLNLATGEVEWLDEDGATYTVGPCMLIARSDHGPWGEASRIWRCGKLVSDCDDDGREWAQ